MQYNDTKKAIKVKDKFGNNVLLLSGDTLRYCLRCEKGFPSAGIGNRMCSRCKNFT